MANIELYKARMETADETKAFYPHTSTDIVFDKSGKTLETILDDIENGVMIVGDSNMLGGKSASEYATKTDLEGISGGAGSNVSTYTKTEIDEKTNTLKTSIDAIVEGTTVVAKAASAAAATSAIQDGNGNVIATTYATVASLETLTVNALYTGAGVHNSVYRGKYLGTEVTDEQYSAINTGTFEDLYIGDYWTIGGINYRIAAFDYYYNTGNTACTTHHITIVPDTCFYTAQMNSSNVVTGAYIGSAMYTSNLNTAKTTITNAFGSDHILTHRQYLKNAVSSGYETAGSWYNASVVLMTEQNVYGCKVLGNCLNGTSWTYSHTIDKTQYPLFRFRPDLIGIRTSYWLRDVASATDFCSVGASGSAHALSASYALGVRPAFSIC